jgi:protein O-GlcNAc transferase
MAIASDGELSMAWAEPPSPPLSFQPAFNVEFAYVPPLQTHRESDVSRISMRGANQQDHVIRRIRRTGTFYEIDLLEHIAQCGPLGGTYIDVGANIGNHSIYFGKFLADFLIAVEPVPDTADVLDFNLRSNGVTNYVLVRAGLGAEPGVGMTILADNETNVGMTRVELVKTGVGDTVDATLVALDTLDRVVEAQAARGERMPVRFVKIDVEGAELDVLRGAADVLQQYRPQLAIELATRQAYQEVGEFLSSYGYRKVGKFCGTPTYHFFNPQRDQLRAYIA